MRVDLDQRLLFPTGIVSTTLRPDLVLRSDGSLGGRHRGSVWTKKLCYSNLVTEAANRGWRKRAGPLDVGCRGCVASTTAKLLREVGIRGQAQRQTIKELANTAEGTRATGWLKRSDTTWASTTNNSLRDTDLWRVCLSRGCTVINDPNTLCEAEVHNWWRVLLVKSYSSNSWIKRGANKRECNM